MSAPDSPAVVAQAREAWTTGRAIVDTTLNRIFADARSRARAGACAPSLTVARHVRRLPRYHRGLAAVTLPHRSRPEIDPQLRLWTVGRVDGPGNAEVVIASDADLADVHTFWTCLL